MDTTGLIVAIFMSIIFLLKFFLACFGFDSDTINDVDGTECGTTTVNSYGLDTSDIISLKGFLHFMFGFSWSWACFGVNGYYSILAIGVGLVCVILLAFTYKFISKLDVETKNEPLSNLAGRKGSVYYVLKNDDGSINKVLCQIKYNDKLDIVEAFTDDNVNTGDSVYVNGVFNNSHITIKKIN